jgi:chorismate-pyruvate lyase
VKESDQGLPAISRLIKRTDPNRETNRSESGLLLGGIPAPRIQGNIRAICSARVCQQVSQQFCRERPSHCFRALARRGVADRTRLEPEIRDSMMGVARKPGLRAALNGTKGTVTNFLEELVGERIAAERYHHERIVAPALNDLGVEEGELLLRRAAALKGSVSGQPYVYAESMIVVSRLPASFFHRLETSNDPIGRLLDEAGIAATRDDLVEGLVVGMDRPWNFDEIVSGYLLARTYRIDSRQTPLMIISEWFLGTLAPFFPDGADR